MRTAARRSVRGCHQTLPWGITCAYASAAPLGELSDDWARQKLVDLFDRFVGERAARKVVRLLDDVHLV
jgi:hypothetical protein